eukprot:356387-Chlamydomonas_euryale.AAC.5
MHGQAAHATRAWACCVCTMKHAWPGRACNPCMGMLRLHLEARMTRQHRQPVHGHAACAPWSMHGQAALQPVTMHGHAAYAP